MSAKDKINTGIETREVSDLTPGLSSVQMADEEIPVIDLGPMWSEDEVGKVLLAEQVSTACQEIGFFYVKNHGVPDSIIADAQRVSGEFFKQSEETKMLIEVSGSSSNRLVEKLRINRNASLFQVFKGEQRVPTTVSAATLRYFETIQGRFDSRKRTTDIRMPLFRSRLLRIWIRCIPLTLQEHV